MKGEGSNGRVREGEGVGVMDGEGEGGRVMDGGVGQSNRGRGRKGGMKEWCGVVEEEQWNSPGLVVTCVCSWVLAAIHACSFSFVGSHCSFIDSCHPLVLYVRGWVVVICGHSIFMGGGS